MKRGLFAAFLLGAWMVDPVSADPGCLGHGQRAKDLVQAASSSSSQEEFLRRLGERRSLFSTFSFVLESDGSPLSKSINERFPGPVLVSADGRIALRWSCDRSGASYGLVDMFYFSGEPAPQGPYETYRFDFRKVPPGGKPQKVSVNPPSCLSCHSTVPNPRQADFRPISGQYPTWEHFIGSHDDYLDPVLERPGYVPGEPDKPKDLKLKRKEKRALANAKRRAKAGDVCYSSLPWSDLDPKSPSPYLAKYKGEDLSRRPGFLLSMLFSDQAAQAAPLPPVSGNDARLAALCLLVPAGDQFMKACGPDWGLRLASKCPTVMSSGSGFFAEARRSAREPIDRQRAPQGSRDYEASFYDGDLSTSERLKNRWLKAALAAHPKRERIESLLTGKANEYQGPWSCPQSGGRLAWLPMPPSQSACEFFKGEFEALEAAMNAAQGCDPFREVSAQAIVNAAQVAAVGSIERGREIAETRCLGCHEGSKETAVGPALHLTDARLFKRGEELRQSRGQSPLIDVVAALTSTQGPERMPSSGAPLTSEERASLLDYLNSLSR